MELMGKIEGRNVIIKLQSQKERIFKNRKKNKLLKDCSPEQPIQRNK